MAGRRALRHILLGFLVAAATGCAAVSPSQEPPPPPPDVMRVYYATDRAPVTTAPPYFGEERGGLKIGRAEVAVVTAARPAGDAVSRPATTPAPRNTRWLHDPQPLDLQRALAVDSRRAAEKTATTTTTTTTTRGVGGSANTADAAADIGDQPVLIFVHGFNVAPESAIATAAQLAYDVGFTGAVFAFVWPSRVSIDRYASDEESAQWAAPHLAELIRRLKDKPDRPVHVVAHSMGSRVACGALQRLACGGDAVGELPKLGRLILAAPDIDADIFKAQIVDEIRPLVAGITIYASNDDAALKLSQRIHKWTRAGETGDWVPPGEQRFELVDCSGLDLSKTVGSDLIGHSYYGAAHVAEDMQSVLGTTARPRPATRPPGSRYLTLPPPPPRRAAPRWAGR